MNPSTEKLRPHLIQALTRDAGELALGFLRYEAIRRLNLPELEAIVRRSLQGGGHFDDLVDEEILKSKSIFAKLKSL